MASTTTVDGRQVDLMPHHLLETSPFAILQAAQGGFNQSDPGVQRIFFSKHFVPTYYAVLLCLVAAFAIGRWLTHKHERDWKVPAPGSRSQSGIISRADAQDGHGYLNKDTSSLESSPLLSQTEGGLNGRDRIRRYLRSWLLYQPQPVPAVTAPRNVLPPNNVSLVVILLMAINLFYLFYRNVPPYCGLDAFATRAALCCVMNIPIIYVLAAKNNYLLLRATGWSYDGLNIYHRRLAEWMLILAGIHVFGMLGVWYINFIPRGLSWAYFFNLKIIILGISGISCFLLIWITSIGYIRRKAYEAFLAVHLVAQFAFLGFLFFHHRNTRPYTGVALCIWLVDRIIVRTCLSPRKFIATLEIAPDQQTTLVYVEVPLYTGSGSLDLTSGWQPGQHVFISIPSLGFGARFQRHPFTIASPAPPFSNSKEPRQWPLQLIVRANGGFSQQLLAFARLHQHVEVLLDGPYGSLDAIEAVQRADRCAFVAGGSGISVTYPLAWVAQTAPNTKALSKRITYREGMKHVPHISVSEPKQNRNYYHIWIHKHEIHRNWISFLPAESMASPSNELVETVNGSERASNLISSMYSTANGSSERPNAAAELRNWVRDYHRTQATLSSRMCVIVSGPDELAREIRNCVSVLAREGWNIELVVEKFNW